MKAMLLEGVKNLEKDKNPLRLCDFAVSEPAADQVLIKVKTCGVCHTELDEIEGRTPPSVYPVIPGHQVVGIVNQVGERVTLLKVGDRVGVAWIWDSCGNCEFCIHGLENLCAAFKATGRDAHGGYAEYMVVPENYAFKIPEVFSDAEAAPLLCAGAIGYRSLELCNIKNGQRLGLTGFGASAHLVLKMTAYRYPDSEIYVFARSPGERQFAMELGATWAGDTTDKPPANLHAIIDTTPVWKPVIEGLANLAPNGRLVINAIRKEEIDKQELLNLSYPEHLWLEKEIKSVANVARKDVSEFLNLAAKIPIKPAFQEYALTDANTALLELKQRKIRGAKVLRID
jgi:propanol-preferring alcohol dehydrogenase